jgi:hypothetical protein
VPYAAYAVTLTNPTEPQTRTDAVLPRVDPCESPARRSRPARARGADGIGVGFVSGISEPRVRQSG